jgi:uncharacterized protein YndB with AHSA1/START domain/DNA-binding transcriptional ArsR family regulator
MMEQDAVFKALADANRRKLLDLLFLRDGQTLSELSAHLDMTRFGTMKHLQILEDAGLVTTRKQGREKFHYLNPIPIQMVYDRWVSKYGKGWARALTELKYDLEDEPMTEQQQHVYEVFIRTTPERLWQALTDGNMTEKYYFGGRMESTWQAGAPYIQKSADGMEMIGGDVLEADPPRKLVTTFRVLWNPEDSALVSRVTYEITQMGAACKLAVIHENVDAGQAQRNGFASGWAQILSGLKTLLETGEPLIVEAPQTA